MIRAGLDAKAVGADALRITPVFYHGATEQENYEFFREIGEAVRLPVIIYNVVPGNIIMNKPTVLSTGEWLMPVTHAAQPVHEWFAGPAQRQGVGISRDPVQCR